MSENTTTPQMSAELGSDPRRWFWPFAYAAVSLTPIMGLGLWAASGGASIMLFFPLIITFALVPLLDALIGEDHTNLSAEMLESMSKDGFYMRALHAVAPIGYVTFITAIIFLVTQDVPLWAGLGFLVGTGILNGQMITLGHELGHKTDSTNRFWAKLALGAVGYGHFTAEHNLGHHKNVSTPEDCASGRLGESVYAFATRELPGALKGGLAIEAKRLEKRGHSFWSVHNDILQTYAITIGVAAVLLIALGWAALPWILLHHAIAWFALTNVNYIEHYGLLRERRENGRYGPCEPKHSWNANHIVSNLVQFHLQRHSDHHAHPARPYQALRSHDQLPHLPTGYPGCLVLALIPPLWFKVMDKRVLDWADGDLEKTNIHEPARARLEAKWGKAA